MLPAVNALTPTDLPRHEVPNSAPFTRLDLAVLGAVLVLGAINLAQPFGWDQAIFTIAARRMHEGAVLYRDIWDVKQPGLFLFYLLGGSAFGFTEIGIHVFELLYLLIFSLVLQRCLKRVLAHPWVASITPLFVVGFYYAFVGDWHLTQAEGLAGFPMFCSLWWAVQAAESDRHRGRRLFLSGLCGGIVLAFKLLFLPLLLCLWVTVIASLARRGRVAGGLAADVALVAGGTALPFILLAAYFAANGALQVAWWTNITYPLTVRAPHAENRFKWLVDGLSWFVARWAPLLGLASLAFFSPSRRPRGLVGLNLGLWCVAGLIVILIQPLSWWQYHYLLITVPVGVLAASGLDLLVGEAGWTEGRREALAVGTALAMLCSWAVGAAALKALFFANDRFALTAAGRLKHEIRMSRGNAYAKVLADVRFLSAPGNRPGPIFVAGNPLVHWLSRRDPVLPRFGGVLTGYASAEEWTQIASGLRAKRPPYVFVQGDELEGMQRTPERSGPFLALLAADYRVVQQSRMGVWWELRDEAGHVR